MRPFFSVLAAPLLTVLIVMPATGHASQLPRPDTVTVSSQGLRLTALLWRPEAERGSPAVLFLHGGSCEAGGADRLGPLFAAHGYVFLYLFRRGHGLSVGQGVCAGILMDQELAKTGAEGRSRLQFQLLTTDHFSDALSGLTFLRAQPSVDASRIVVAGHSFGGQLAILAAERDSSLRAAVNFAGAANSWDQSAELRTRLIEAVSHTVVPMFFIHAANDYSVAPGQTMAAEMTRLGKPHQLKIYPPVGQSATDGHMFVLRAPDQWERDVFQFLSDHLGR